MKTSSIALTLFAFIASAIAQNAPATLYACRCFFPDNAAGAATGAVRLCPQRGGNLTDDGHLCRNLVTQFSNADCSNYLGEAGWEASCLVQRNGLTQPGQ